MTDETLKQYILDYKPAGDRDIQIAQLDDYKFTFLIQDGKAIGAVLDMNWEPHVYILEEYRTRGYGTRLLKKYLVENELVGSNEYVYYSAGTDAGEQLIKRFSMLNHEFTVLKVDDRKYINRGVSVQDMSNENESQTLYINNQKTMIGSFTAAGHGLFLCR